MCIFLTSLGEKLWVRTCMLVVMVMVAVWGHVCACSCVFERLRNLWRVNEWDKRNREGKVREERELQHRISCCYDTTGLCWTIRNNVKTYSDMKLENHNISSHLRRCEQIRNRGLRLYLLQGGNMIPLWIWEWNYSKCDSEDNSSKVCAICVSSQYLWAWALFCVLATADIF